MSSTANIWRSVDTLSPEEKALYDALVDAIIKTSSDSRYAQTAIECIRQVAPLDIISKRSEYSILEIACEQQFEAIALAMIEAGAPLEGKYTFRSPLMIAIRNGMERTAIALIEKGANLSHFDSNHKTPLHLAAERGMDNVVLKLIEYGAPLDAEDKFQDTPLQLACDKGYTQIALHLIAGGALQKDVRVLGKKPLVAASLSHMDTVMMELMKQGVPADHEDKGMSTALYHTNIQDMYRRIATDLLLPALYLESEGEFGTISSLRESFLKKAVDCLHPIPKTKLDKNAPVLPSVAADYLRRLRLSRTWHHPPIVFPRSLRPHKPNRSWVPLLDEPFLAPNGVQVHCLTSSEALQLESRMLGHCVGDGDYDDKCCAEGTDRSHIFSLRDEHGIAMSTAELKYNDDGEFVTAQHEGKNGATPPQQAKEAWTAFVAALESGALRVKDAESLGEIRREKTTDIPEIWEKIGFEPTWNNINRALDEYKMPYRRASLPVTGRALEYDDIISEDKYRHMHHFIDGYVLLDKQDVPVRRSYRLLAQDVPKPKDGQRCVSVRELDARSWLRATGLMGLIHREINEQLGIRHERTARWEAQEREPVVFREVPKPRHEIAARYASRGDALRERASKESVAASFPRYELPS